MEYQELELGIAKKLSEKTKSHFSYQLIINGCFLLGLVCFSVGFLCQYYQIQMLHWHLNATHVRVRELERWQKHMCSIRHYNCPEDIETPEYVDDWDWDNFPSMDDYTYDNGGVESIAKDAERRKREIIAETTDGADAKQVEETRHTKMTTKRQNISTPPSSHAVPVVQAGYHSLAWPATNQKPELKLHHELNSKMTITSKPIITRTSRVSLEKDDKAPEQKPKASPRVKSLETRSYPFQSSDDYNSYSNPRPTHRRRIPATQRQRISESFEDDDVAPVVPAIVRPARRHMPVAHFHGDTSKYAMGIHQNYHVGILVLTVRKKNIGYEEYKVNCVAIAGNGHLKHLDRTYVDWISSDWMEETNRDGIFDLKNGVLTIHEDGLYFVYSQIFYMDDHDLNGYHVYRNQDMILQCTTMTHSTTRVRKSNTCYTAGVERLASGDKIYVRDLSNERFSLFEKGKSFFGVVKLSDMRVK